MLPAPRGVPQIEVTFDIDANGIVHVSAKDKATNKEHKITITNTGGLSKEEIEQKIKEAQSHEEEDRKAKEMIEKKNRLDSLIYDIEKTLNENKDKLSEEDIKATEEALEKAKSSIAEPNQTAESIQQITDDLLKASHKVAEILYNKAQQENKPSENEEPSSTEDENQ